MDMSKPLAYRMSPKTLDDYVGQEHILGKDKILYRTIKADRLSSIILWGPPGCGKTSLARVISNTTKCKFLKIEWSVDLIFNNACNVYIWPFLGSRKPTETMLNLLL